jgi:hypothetical protein
MNFYSGNTAAAAPEVMAATRAATQAAAWRIGDRLVAARGKPGRKVAALCEALA